MQYEINSTGQNILADQAFMDANYAGVGGVIIEWLST